MRSMRKTLHSLKDTRFFVKRILAKLPTKGTHAEILALSGELGSGKTAFTKLLARELGIIERVISPTFILERDYSIKKNKKQLRFTRLVHIDAYRFDSEKDLKPLRLESKFNDPHNLVVIEWAERIKKALPKNTHWTKFSFVDENTRRVEFQKLKAKS